MPSQTQILVYFLGSITLLIALIVALICIVVLRDRRELKTKEMAAGLSKLENVVSDLERVRGEIMPAVVSFKKHEAALAQIEGQLKQIGSAIANLEHRPQPGPQPVPQSGPQPVPQPAGAIREKQDDHRDRDRGPRQPGRGKGWGGNRSDGRRKEFVSAAAGDTGEAVAINDGERYAKVSELAAHGMTAQEIAKKLNVGTDEVALVLDLKSKKPE